MSTATAYAPTGSRGERVRKALIGTAPIFLVLLVLLVWIAIVNPNFLEPPVFLAFLKRAAPLVILAAGQYFVIVAGEYDLSVGSLVTVIVVVAARLIDGDPGKTWPVIALLLAIGVAVGDNESAARLSGVRVENMRTIAFVLSGLSAAVAGILLGGFAGVSAQVGQGLEFQAITAVVLGGVVLGGGRGTVLAAMAGALTLEALFTLLNLYGVSGALEDTVQGIIIIAAVAFASYRLRGAR